MKHGHLAKLMQRYPAMADLRDRARSRIPHIAWEYLDSGTGDEKAVARNLDAMANVTLVPRFMRGRPESEVATTLFGQSYNAPFGVAPIGLGGLMWPRAERILARTAASYSIPCCLSTVAAESVETIGPLMGDMGWFQLYPPRDPELRNELLARAKASGFHTMVVTADVPGPSRRERCARAGLCVPPRITPRFVWEALLHPTWTVQTLRAGLPNLETIKRYADSASMRDVVEFSAQHLGWGVSWDYLAEVRDRWDGPLVLKGILHPDEAERAVQVGVDGVQVSNHGGRQLDAVPAAIDLLPAIVQRVNGSASIIFDSGVRSGLDIARAIALGADFVMLGRAFMYGVAALGAKGADHVVEILLEDLHNSMVQLGCSTLMELRGLERGGPSPPAAFDRC